MGGRHSVDRTQRLTTDKILFQQSHVSISCTNFKQSFGCYCLAKRGTTELTSMTQWRL